MATRSSNPAAALSETTLRSRVVAQVNPALRIAAMLERWSAEDVSDEPEWDVSDIERVALRSPTDP